MRCRCQWLWSLFAIAVPLWLSRSFIVTAEKLKMDLKMKEEAKIMELAMHRLEYGLRMDEQTDDQNLIRITNATASSTSSETAQTGTEDYIAQRATSRGSGYWCSQGGHTDAKVVSWTGQAKARRVVSGVRIEWAYSPGEYQIQTSFDGIGFDTALDWTANERSMAEEEYEQDLIFPSPMKIYAIRINMRKPIHKFFGLRFVALIGADMPLMQIISGITSISEEMCLQVDSGMFVQGTELILDGCLDGISEGDGRELFRFTKDSQLINTPSGLCVALKNNVDEGGGSVVLDDCQTSLSSGDGRATFQLQPNNQLKFGRKGSWCLSFKGAGAGFANVARGKPTQSSHPDPSGSEHSPDKATDSDSSTYWASQAFDYPAAVPEVVYFDVKLGDLYKLSRIAVQWEFPPSQYKVMVSTDGRSWIPSGAIVANALNNTVDALHSVTASYLRLEMNAPHPTYSVRTVGAAPIALYGIRSLIVLANRLQSVVSPCQKASESPDARDKFFFELVGEFHIQPGKQLQRAKESFYQITRQLEYVTTEIEQKESTMKKCKEDRAKNTDRLRGQASQMQRLGGRLEDIRAKRHSDISERNLLTECSSIKQSSDDFAVSGFYTVHPKCSSTPLRVFCDMNSTASIYVIHGRNPQPPGSVLTAEYQGPMAVQKDCGNAGLIPFTLTSENQIPLLRNALAKMNYDGPNATVFPLAYDMNKNGRMMNLDNNQDLTDMFRIGMGVAPQNRLSLFDTVGITAQADTRTPQTTIGVDFFDWITAPIGGALCMIPTIADLNIAPVSCMDTARYSHQFQGWHASTFIVKCPPSCSKVKVEGSAPIVIGSDGIYRDDSSVCLAAEHMAALGGNGGIIVVTILPGRSAYHGKLQNSVQSEGYNGHWDRSFSVAPYDPPCPHKETQEEWTIRQTTQTISAPATSFLQTRLDMEDLTDGTHQAATGSASQTQIVSANMTEFSDETTELAKIGISSYTQPIMNPVDLHTGALVHRLIEAIRTKTGIDPDVVTQIAEEAGNSVSTVRAIVKSIEELEQKNEERSEAIGGRADQVTSALEELTGEVMAALGLAQTEMRAVVTKKALLWGFASIPTPSLGSLFGPAFWKFFEGHDSDNAVDGPSRWSPQATTIGGREFPIAQTSPIRANSTAAVGVGTYLGYRGRKLFDFAFQTDYLVDGEGVVGMYFRSRNFKTMYLIEMRLENGGFKKLYSLNHGTEKLLATNFDGGYQEGVWYTLRIEAVRDDIKVLSAEAGQKLQTIFHVQDDSFLSGGAGFFCSGVKNLLLSRYSVTVDNCALPIPHPPPFPAECSRYTFDPQGRFKDDWHVHNPPESEPSPRWEYRGNVAGRKRVIVQYFASVGGTKRQSSLSILKGHRLCSIGTFSFDFLPQCADGEISGLIQYESPAHYDKIGFTQNEMSHREVRNGKEQIVNSVRFGFIPGAWNSVNIELREKSFIVQLNADAYRLESVVRNPGPAARTGVATWNCGGAAFDRVTLAPPVKSRKEEISFHSFLRDAESHARA